jgi:RNase H-like domain found in reverse transcriptase
MDDVLRPHQSYADAYIDDVCVYSPAWMSHLKHLDGVLTSIADVGMRLKLSKCRFGKTRVKFIGHEVGSGSRSPLRDKLEAIKAVPEPHNKKLLRSFLWMCSFYREYIPNYSEVALPLTELTKNKRANSIRFNEAEQSAFLDLKEKLCKVTSLYSPLPNKPFIIRCDASDHVVGACLSQVDDLEKERPIAFTSSKLSDVQRRWATIERESYAVIFALTRFDVFIFWFACKYLQRP